MLADVSDYFLNREDLLICEMLCFSVFEHLQRRSEVLLVSVMGGKKNDDWNEKLFEKTVGIGMVVESTFKVER